MSAECTCISELMFTSQLEPSAVRFKRHRVIHLVTESWIPLLATIHLCL
ncbi:unnamed protein product [Schistosoma margrebowiei]|uniref:Uncharacterized protein n=1 Tax=Schistosoma margrebowiei TaxID=48269 RepID=A0A3P8FYM2_9TREM|nr:unnamed protein product [Schistosoma margrebowiei]